MFTVMARKNKLNLADDIAAAQSRPTASLSGADIESIVLAAKRTATGGQRDEVTSADMELALKRVHSLGARAWKRNARDGGRAGMHADQLLAAAWRAKIVPARRRSSHCRSAWWRSGN